VAEREQRGDSFGIKPSVTYEDSLLIHRLAVLVFLAVIWHKPAIA